jgi:hypothetical protein
VDQPAVKREVGNFDEEVSVQEEFKTSRKSEKSLKIAEKKSKKRAKGPKTGEGNTKL